MMRLDMMTLTAATALIAGQAVAAPDYTALRDAELEVVHSLFSDFQTASHDLADAAVAYCETGDDMMPAYRHARTAWAPLEGYQFGPMEQTGASLSINFWPDTKGFTRRALRELYSLGNERLADIATISARSAAIQGFPALETILTDDSKADCPVVASISAHIAMKADELQAAWFDANGWADLARAAGPDNPVYLTNREFSGEIFTALNYILFRMQEMALKRPLGDMTGPKPNRAEAWQTGMSLEVAKAQLESIARMIDEGFTPAISAESRARMTQAVTNAARHIDNMMPLTDAVADAQGLWQLEGLKNRIAYVAMLLDTEIGPVLGVKSGFSPADGD